MNSRKKIEEWLPVVGWEGVYEVSSLGRVKRVLAARGATLGRITEGSLNENGYLQVRLRTRERGETVTIHRLVAQAFLGPCPPDSEVNHKDGNKTNNDVENLEWVTYGENQKHAYDTGLRRITAGEEHGRALISEADAREILNLKGQMRQAVIAERFGVKVQVIQRIHQRTTWQHL